MRKNAILISIAALLVGAVGAYLRRLELQYGFEETTGLAVTGAPGTIALIALSVAAVLLCAVLAFLISSRYTSPKGYENAFAPVTPVSSVVQSALGAVWLAASVWNFFALRASGPVEPIEFYFLILSALAAISVICLSIGTLKNPEGKANLLFSVVPSLFLCFWLILLYKRNAANPVLLSYCYQCLAIITATLGYYFTAGYVYGKNAPGKTVASCLAAVFFCCVTLADNIAAPLKVIFAVIAATHLIRAFLLIRNLEKKADK